MASHSSLIGQKAKDLRSSGWIVAEQAKFQGFIFDILAIKPETRKIHVCEVTVASESRLAEKARFCKENDISFEVLSNSIRKCKKNSAQISEICFSLGDTFRVELLRYVVERATGISFSELQTMLGLNPTKDAGRFVYHLRALKSGNLIRKDGSLWKPSELGIRFYTLLNELVDSQSTVL